MPLTDPVIRQATVKSKLYKIRAMDKEYTWLYSPHEACCMVKIDLFEAKAVSFYSRSFFTFSP